MRDEHTRAVHPQWKEARANKASWPSIASMPRRWIILVLIYMTSAKKSVADVIKRHPVTSFFSSFPSFSPSSSKW